MSAQAWKWGVAVAAAAAATAVIAWWGLQQRPLVLAGVVEVQEVHLGSKVGGRVGEVLVREGDGVEAGAVLVRLEMPEHRARRDQWAAGVAQAEAVLERWRNGPRAEEIEEAEASVAAGAARLAMLQEWTRPEELRRAEAEREAAQADAALAESTFRRVEKLHRERVASPQEFDDARSARDGASARARALQARSDLLKAGARAEEIAAAREELRQARARLDLLKAGTRPEVLAEAKAQLDQARAALAEAEAQLREGEVRAPVACRVEVLSVRKGDLVAPGRPFARVLDLEEIWVRAYCPEPDLGHLRVGGGVQVRVDTWPDREFPGKVVQIAGESEFTPRNIQSLDERWNQVFSLKVKVDAAPGLLKPGMAALVRVPRPEVPDGRD